MRPRHGSEPRIIRPRSVFRALSALAALSFPALLALVALLAAFFCLGCHGPTRNEPETTRGYRILDFALLGDSALALRIETWENRNPPDSAPWPRKGFVLLDRKQGMLRSLDSLPISAAPAFPDWFYACDSGRPVSVHPPGTFGPAGACSMAYAPAIDPFGYSLAFADSQARVNLLSRELEPITYLASGADSVRPLEIGSSLGRVFVLEWHGRKDSVLWRGFANDDPSGSDTAWLVRPMLVRVHGAGIRLVCGEAEESANPLACWSAGVPGFREAVAEAIAEAANKAAAQAAPASILPEWDPATGKLAWLDAPARFVFLDPGTGDRKVFDAGPLLDGYRP